MYCSLLKNYTLLFSFFTFFLFPSALLAQKEVPPLPTEETSVYDEANILSVSEENQLKQKLINYADTTSTQIVIATIKSVQGGSMDMLATEWAHKWGVGQAKKDNGLFILVSEGDRKIEIKTGYGLEPYLTDALLNQIIDQIILPEFRKGDYYTGLDKGTTAVFQVLNGTFEGVPQKENGNRGIPIRLIFLGIFFVFILIAIFSRKNRGGGKGGQGRHGADFLDILILSSLGSSIGRGGFGGGSGGGFGGGGFGGGFGGGGFGGGGAGGGW